MSISLDKDRGFLIDGGEQLGLECPHCGVYATMSPQSIPQTDNLMRDKPAHVGLVFQCDSCKSPVFLRFTIRAYAFASMCRRAAASAFDALGEGGKLQAFDEVMVAKDIAGIDAEAFDPIQAILFEAEAEQDLPLLNRAQAGILLEILKDLLYQCFVRRGKLTRAIKVRQFFVEGDNDDFQSTA